MALFNPLGRPTGNNFLFEGGLSDAPIGYCVANFGISGRVRGVAVAGGLIS